MAAWRAGIVVVASAGNTGPEPMTIGVPGNVPYIITVGAMTDRFTPADPGDDYVLASFYGDIGSVADVGSMGNAWSDAYVWSDAFAWSDADVWSDAFAWSDTTAIPAFVNVWVDQE